MRVTWSNVSGEGPLPCSYITEHKLHLNSPSFSHHSSSGHSLTRVKCRAVAQLSQLDFAFLSASNPLSEVTIGRLSVRMVNTTAAMVSSGRGSGVLPLASLNHISIVCRSVEESLDFYMNVLGFIPVRRPGSFNFDGAWLFNYGIGIHLLQSEEPETLPEKTEINPKDNHISFQCESMPAVERRLKELDIPYIKRCVEEGGIYVDQIFFHDPDGFMIEICNCDNLPVVPLADQTFAMASCKRVIVKQQPLPPVPVQAAPPATAAAAAQCVPSANKAMPRVAGEEAAAHISCA